jgi:hypothetical protein
MDLSPPHLHHAVTLALPVTSFATLMFVVSSVTSDIVYARRGASCFAFDGLSVCHMI